MSLISNISLIDDILLNPTPDFAGKQTANPQDIKITQLYQHLELYSEGEPPAQTIFVQGQSAQSPLASVQLEDMADANSQLILIDPPTDTPDKFRLEGNVAALYTCPLSDAPQIEGLPMLENQPGGVAHIRIGVHFLDVYTQQTGAIVHLPALGIICGGNFGSDATLPKLISGSDGMSELDTLRLLARLVRSQRLQLYIPRIGEPKQDVLTVMQRLADDVAYLHGLRRVVGPLVERRDSLEQILEIGASLQPASRSSLLSAEIHQHNLHTLYQSSLTPLS
ncbi:MAG: hypothetical protein AAF639_22500 [Chloroflexota bacterium]